MDGAVRLVFERLKSSVQLDLSPSPERAPSRQTSMPRFELSPSPDHPTASVGNPRFASFKRFRNSERTHKSVGEDIKLRRLGRNAVEALAMRQDWNGEALVNLATKRQRCDRKAEAPQKLVATTSTGTCRLQLESSSLDDGGTDIQRKRMFFRERLAEALGGKTNKLGVATEIAAQIDDALHEQLEEKEYAIQARAILFNLKHVGEGSLKQKLLAGKCEPKQLPKMTADGLANDAIKSARETARRKSADASTVKPDAHYETDKFTCGMCSGTRTEHDSYEELRGHGIYTVSDVSCLRCGHVWTEHSKG